jgi:hypothetical protein
MSTCRCDITTDPVDGIFSWVGTTFPILVPPAQVWSKFDDLDVELKLV